MKLTGNETAQVTVYDEKITNDEVEEYDYEYDEDLYESIRKRIYDLLTRFGCMPFLSPPHGSSGFILMPRSNGGAVGVYYRHIKHVTLQEYTAFRDEKLTHYKNLLLVVPGCVVQEIPTIEDGDPGWHVEFFDNIDV